MGAKVGAEACHHDMVGMGIRQIDGRPVQLERRRAAGRHALSSGTWSRPSSAVESACRGEQLASFCLCRRQSLKQQAQCLVLWALARAAFESTDRGRAEPRALGQDLLRKAGRHARTP